MSDKKVVKIRSDVKIEGVEPATGIEKVLDDAKKKLESGIVIGTTKNGTMYFGTDLEETPECLWLMELAKQILLEASISDFHYEEE